MMYVALIHGAGMMGWIDCDMLWLILVKLFSFILILYNGHIKDKMARLICAVFL